MKKKELLSQNTHLKKTIAELKHDMFKSKLEIAVDMLSGLGELELTDARETCRSGLGITRTLTFVLTINNQKQNIMKKKELKKVYETFNNLNEKEQWEWLLTTNLKPFFEIGIDNDNTSIYFDCDKDADYLMYFKSDIGNREGVLHLLEAIGCRASHV